MQTGSHTVLTGTIAPTTPTGSRRV